MNGRAKHLREGVVERAVQGPGKASPDARRAAFENSGGDERARLLVGKIARHAWKVTREDVAVTKAAGVAEDEIFELAVCAALGQATRQLESALAALDMAGEADSDQSVAGPGGEQESREIGHEA
jgi:hypothetical protein